MIVFFRHGLQVTFWFTPLTVHWKSLERLGMKIDKCLNQFLVHRSSESYFVAKVIGQETTANHWGVQFNMVTVS